jgi:ABC-2 type transport system ATP-binding protein
MFKVSEIKKSFKNKEVLKGVSFTIEDGDKVALLGNNGAGKSTLLKIIAGQLEANAGRIETPLDFQTEIGMMPQGDILIDDLKVGDLVLLKCYMNQLEDIDIEALLKMVELEEYRNQYVMGLSGGQKRRLSLLLTILNEPRLIFLDEPTTGMDLESVDNFWHLLEEQKFTAVVVTHDFNQIDHFFTKVLILKDGHIAAQESVEDIHRNGQTIAHLLYVKSPYESLVKSQSIKYY